MTKEETAMPAVTIGLPTYNRPAGLRKVLETILLQDYPHLSIIISDNCSTDPDVALAIREFASRDSRIVSFRQSENIGLEENFNFLYAKCNTPYFMWMSDDDVFDANYITECVTFLEQNHDYVLCSGKADYYQEGTLLFEEKMFTVDNRKPASRVYRYFSKVGKNGIFYGVFRYGLLKRKPLDVHPGCDWSFMAKMAIFGKMHYLHSTAYRRSAEGHSGTRKRMVRKFNLNWFQDIFFETYLAYSISSHIFDDPAVNKRIGYLKRKWIAIVVFFQINFKLLKNFLKKKLGMRVH